MFKSEVAIESNHMESEASSREEVDAERRKKQERRLRLLRQSGHLGNDRSGAVYTRAVDAKSLEKAFRLVHDIYVEMGYIPPQQNGLRARHFEFCPETATFIAEIPSHGIIGTITVIQDSVDFGLPSDSVFRMEIDAIRREGRRVCEMSNQAVIKEFRRLGPAGELMRCAWAFAVANGFTDVVCAVSPQLVSLYETICFEQAGQRQLYSPSVEDEVVLMRMVDVHLKPTDFRYQTDEIYKQLIDYYYLQNPHFGKQYAWNMLNNRMFSEEFGIASLLGKCPEIVLNHQVGEALHRRLGNIFELSQLALENADHPHGCHKVVWDLDDETLLMERYVESKFGTGAAIPLRKKKRAAIGARATRSSSSTPPPS